MKKIISILMLLTVALTYAQPGILSSVDRLKIKHNAQKSTASRVLVQDASSKELGWVARSEFLSQKEVLQFDDLAEIEAAYPTGEIGVIYIADNHLTNNIPIYYIWNGSSYTTTIIPITGVTGSGLANYTARWTSPTTLGTGIIRDDGVGLGIGGAPVPGYALSISGNGVFSNYLYANVMNPLVALIYDGAGNLGSRTTGGANVFHFANGSALVPGNITFGRGSVTTVGTETARFDTWERRFGIRTNTPTEALDVNGNIRNRGAYYDINNVAGTSGQILSSTATGTQWVDNFLTATQVGALAIDGSNANTNISIGAFDFTANFISAEDVTANSLSANNSIWANNITADTIAALSQLSSYNLDVQNNLIATKIGIGTNTPTVALDVVGNIHKNGVEVLTQATGLAIDGSNANQDIDLGIYNITAPVFKGNLITNFGVAAGLTDIALTLYSSANNFTAKINSNIIELTANRDFNIPDENGILATREWTQSTGLAIDGSNANQGINIGGNDFQANRLISQVAGGNGVYIKEVVAGGEVGLYDGANNSKIATFDQTIGVYAYGNGRIIVDENQPSIEFNLVNLDKLRVNGNRILSTANSTADLPESTDKRYQTDAQQAFNDATSSIQGQFEGKVTHGVNNSTTTALSSAMLNSQYPTATTGFKVYCTSIVVGAMAYEKTPTGWIGYTVFVP